MPGVHQSFVDALVARRDEVGREAAERIVADLPSYRSLGDDAVPLIAAVIGGFYETLVERWRVDDRLPAETNATDAQPAAGIDLGIPLTDRLAAHRIGSEVIWRVVQEAAAEAPDLDTDFLLWATSVAFSELNALTAAVTEQHLEVEHHHRRWRQELGSTLVEAALRTPPDLELATATIRALGLEGEQTWQVIAVLQCGDAAPLSDVGALGAGRIDRTVLTAQHGRETRIVIAGAPIDVDELDGKGTAAIGVGRPRRRIDQLAASYQRAHDAAVVAGRRGGGALGVDCTRLERFLEGRVAPDDLTDDLLEPLRRLPPEQADLVAESLEAYLDGQCSVTAAARTLHLHPQSFRYRLGKLQSMFGDELLDPSRRLLLHIAITRYRQAQRADGQPQARPMAAAEH